MASHVVRFFLCGLVLLATHTVSCAEEPGGTIPALPEKALLSGTNFVIWIDTQALTGKSIEDTKVTLEAVGLIDAEKLTPESVKQYDVWLSEFVSIQENFVDQGVNSIVMSFGTKDLLVEPGVIMQEESADEDPDAEDNDNSIQPAQLFFNVKPGCDPSHLKAVIIRSVEETGEADDEALADLREAEFHAISDRWIVMVNDDLSMPSTSDETASEEVVKHFLDVLVQEDGAAIRMVWIVNEAAKQQINELLLEPEAFFISGLLQPMRSLDSGTIALWPGINPKLKVSMRFASPEYAEQFQSGVNGILMFVSNMTALAANAEMTEEQKLAQQQALEQTKVMMTLLMFDRNDAVLSKTVDTVILKRMAEVGITFNGTDSETNE